jgi:hypothetical protein
MSPRSKKEYILEVQLRIVQCTSKKGSKLGFGFPGCHCMIKAVNDREHTAVVRVQLVMAHEKFILPDYKCNTCHFLFGGEGLGSGAQYSA